MFASIYGPNTKQDEFFEQAIKYLQEKGVRLEVQYSTIGGDFNVELVKTKKRTVSNYEKKSIPIILDFCKMNCLERNEDSCKIRSKIKDNMLQLYP